MPYKPVIAPGLVQGTPQRLVLPGGYTQSPFRPVLPGGLAQVSDGTAPFVGPLDAYTTDLSVAMSVARRLLSSYTGALIRVRRSSDDTEEDFSYDVNGNLDTAALLAFCGAGDGYIRWLYNQVGNGWDFGRATASGQPRVVSAGALVTDGSFAAAECFTGGGVLCTEDNITNIFGTDSCCIILRMMEPAGGADNLVVQESSNATKVYATLSNNRIYWDYGGEADGRLDVAQPVDWDDNWHWLRVGRITGTQNIVVDTSELATASRTGTNSSSNQFIFLPENFIGFLREAVIWTNGSDGAGKEAALIT